MSRRPIPIKVKSKDLSQIGELLRGGIQQVRVVLRALSLRQLADGFTAPEVAQALPLTAQAVRQIAEEAVKRKLVPNVGRETIRILLQSHDLKPWREKNVVHSRVGPGVHPEDGRRAGHLREGL